MSGNPLTYAPALLLQNCAYSYKVWITVIKPLQAQLRHPKINLDIHHSESLCRWLLPSVPLVSEKNSSKQFVNRRSLPLITRFSCVLSECRIGSNCYVKKRAQLKG